MQLKNDRGAFFLQDIRRRFLNGQSTKKALTFGDLIESAFAALGQRRGTCLVRLAVNSGLVGFLGSKRFVISAA
jgi:hypothetical protein